MSLWIHVTHRLIFIIYKIISGILYKVFYSLFIVYIRYLQYNVVKLCQK